MFPQIIQELQDFFEYSVFYSVSTCNPATPSNSPYRINSSTRNTTTTRLIPCRLLPATVSRVSKHSTWQNKAPSSPTAFQGHTAQAGYICVHVRVCICIHVSVCPCVSVCMYVCLCVRVCTRDATIHILSVSICHLLCIAIQRYIA